MRGSGGKEKGLLQGVLEQAHYKKSPRSKWVTARRFVLERAKGIEPSYKAWEAFVLPLNYARMAVPIDIQLKDNNNIFANCQYFCGKNF